ncbi:hypothetical protein [Bacillus sp. AFS017274]|uniref:hypothetical protein n=1 Tax=Bacillus sp. AFS017274 TaxID=2033488 RepID=UPI000BF6E427|nr:hypothetical protein [Bacillus sp. AFS017274]PEZ76359.1 hypothetical protein CN380_21440 [Bacillus sp. AFS017274]
MIIDKIGSTLLQLAIPQENTIFSSAFKDYGVYYFRDVTNELLQKIEVENYSLLNNLLRTLSLYNISFHGMYRRFNIVSEEETMFHQNDNSKKLEQIVSNAHALKILSNLGYKTIASLSGVNCEKIHKYLNRYLNPAVTELVLLELKEKNGTKVYELEVQGKQAPRGKIIKVNNIIYNVLEDKLLLPFIIMDSGLTVIQECFEQDKIKLMQDIPSDLDTYFSGKKGVGVGKKKKIEEMIQYILETKNLPPQSNNLVSIITEEGQMIIDGTLWELPKRFLDYKIDFTYLNPTVTNVLISRGIVYFRDLTGNLDDLLNNAAGLGVIKRDGFKTFIKKFIMIETENRIVNELELVFKKVVTHEAYEKCDVRDLEVYANRYNYFKGGTKALEQVGREQGNPVTRERVRQIIKNVAKNSVSHFYAFWLEINVLFEKKPYFTVEELENVLRYKGLSDEVLRYIGAILTELKEDYYYNDKAHLFHQAPIEYCEDLHINMKKATEELFQVQLYVNEEHLAVLVQTIQENYPKYPAHLVWNNYIRPLIEKGKTNLFFKGPKEDLVYKVFCMYFEEGLLLPRNVDQLIMALDREIPNHNLLTTERNITAFIQRTAILWDRGFYVPSSFLDRYKMSQFTHILAWIEQHLQDHDLFEMHLGLVLSEFEADLNTMGINNIYSFYTVLKNLQPASLYFRKSPYIRLAKFANMVHVTQAEKIERFFLNEKGPVERAEALKYFTEKIGLPSFSFEQRLSNDCENVLPWSSTQYVHIEYVDVDLAALKFINSVLQKEVHKYDEPIPITVIKRAFLLRAKIHTYQLLFALLKYHYPDEFSYYRYPLLWLNDDSGINQTSLKMQLEVYILEQNRLLYLSEIKDRFIPRGWSENEISSRISMSTKVVPIEKGVIYTHMDVLGISEDDVEQLLKNVHAYYKEHYEKYGKFYLPMKEYVLREFEENYTLPKMNFNQYWTKDLFTAVLKNSGLFFTPFFKEQVLFARDNEFGIEDSESIIKHILKTQFDGYTTLANLKAWLEEHEIMTYKLFNRIFQEEGDAPYAHDGVIISLKQ